MPRALGLTLVAAVVAFPAGAVWAAPALVPQPREVVPVACARPLRLAQPLSFERGTDPGGFELLRERWVALGIPAPELAADPHAAASVSVSIYSAGGGAARSAYALDAAAGGVRISAGSAEAAFDGLMTLAQLPERDAHGWTIPCVRIADEPALRWRVLSDDVSRGPFPTPAYARARIRALASLKYNGWSPYMEQVVVDPRTPFVAWPNGWTPAQLGDLARYARRFHVALIPEQQTFAHMHESLKWEALAPLAELPHGYLLTESDPRTYRYLEPLVRSVVEATRPVPFVHVGSDEPIDLGRGRTPRTAKAFADHVTRVASYLRGSGARAMIWDDAIQQDPAILKLIPRDVVVVTFHYGVESSYRRYVDGIANAGFAQMVAPGAANWNEIYPDLQTAYANVGRFVADAKGSRGMLGMFMTVWHDDGETLYESTWAPVAFAAASAWQSQPVDERGWHRTFARAFFGSDDARFADDLDRLEAIRSLLRTTPSDPIDDLFWRDPFDARLQARAQALDLVAVRTRAETVMADLWETRPPLHAEAAAAMRLGALRYDQFARRLQIGQEARDYYEDGRTHATKPNLSAVFRSLSVAKYLCWELRNGLSDLEPLYAAAWRYESTEPGLDRMLVRYRTGEDRAQRCADRIDGVIREDYLRAGRVPPWDEVMSSAR